MNFLFLSYKFLPNKLPLKVGDAFILDWYSIQPEYHSLWAL